MIKTAKLNTLLNAITAKITSIGKSIKSTKSSDEIEVLKLSFKKYMCVEQGLGDDQHLEDLIYQDLVCVIDAVNSQIINGEKYIPFDRITYLSCLACNVGYTDWITVIEYAENALEKIKLWKKENLA